MGWYHSLISHVNLMLSHGTVQFYSAINIQGVTKKNANANNSRHRLSVEFEYPRRSSAFQILTIGDGHCLRVFWGAPCTNITMGVIFNVNSCASLRQANLHQENIFARNKNRTNSKTVTWRLTEMSIGRENVGSVNITQVC